MKKRTDINKFRYDINGVRAWAVIAVLLFHFKVPGFEAGFVGVDIFFVVSGYLMTGIILERLEGNSFFLWQFYMARARRILPALMMLLLVLLFLGWFFLPTVDYKSLGAQSAYSLGFISNIHYWRLAGYFDTAAHDKWLLHTWSLGIEMQFYLLYPLYVLLVWKIKPGIKAFTWGLLTIFALSLLLGIVMGGSNPEAAFYLLPFRGWELAVGGLVYLLGRKSELLPNSTLLYVGGLLLWLSGFLLISSELPWPSVWTLLPVSGTALIILAQKGKARLIANPLAQWLGDISYSLYLWHWPLVVALNFAGLQESWVWITAALLLSLLLGHISYCLIENPIRRIVVKISFVKQVFTIGGACVLVGLTAVAVRLISFEDRLPASIETAAAGAHSRHVAAERCRPLTKDTIVAGCIYGENPLGVILIGDSHATSTITALATASEKHKKSALFFGKGACTPVLGLKNKDDSSCYTHNEILLNKELPKYQGGIVPIVHITQTTRRIMGSGGPSNETPRDYFDRLPARYNDERYKQQFKEYFIRTACEISKRNPFYIVRPIPEMNDDVPNSLARNIMFGRGAEDIKITVKEYHERHAFVWSMLTEAVDTCNVKILDPLPYLCDEQYCYGSRNGRPLYRDDNHLNEYGNKLLIPMFEQVF